MDAQDYPGKGLSPSQLVFALNKELERAIHSSPYVKIHFLGPPVGPQERLSDFPHSSTSDQVSQLYQDTLTAFTTVCEWRNSFTPINRMPLDILSLIPTYLTSRKDRFRASFVCRHWRRTLLQCAELWSELFLSKRSVRDDVEVLLKRAKCSALDVHISIRIPVNVMVLLSSRTAQLRHLHLSYNTWEDVQSFSKVNSGPLPLLHTLEIFTANSDIPEDSGAVIPLFRNAVNLEVFRLHSDSELQPFLSHFVFPNLTLFDFSVGLLESLHASQLLDFLETSSMLRTVHMKIDGDISFEGVPQERVVILPNVEYFDLIVGDGGPNHEIAAYISCPSARRTLLKYENGTAEEIEGIFPSSVSWNRIIRQYTTSPLEEVALEAGPFASPVTCNVTFESRGGTFIELGFKDANQGLSGLSLLDMHDHVFPHVIRAVQNYPQLTNIKRLHIYGSFRSRDTKTMEAGQFLWSMGPLDELTLSDCALWPFLHPFYHIGAGHTGEPIPFPPVKEFAIVHPVGLSDPERVAIMGFAMSQHALGIPFERVVLRGGESFYEVERWLGPWVGDVMFDYEELCIYPCCTEDEY